MRIVRQIGLLLVVVGALSAVAASSALAGTPLFLSHGTGKLLASAGNVQKFTTAAGSVECTTLELTQGATTLLRSLSILVTAEYTGCKALTVFTATVSLVQYVIDANGLVRLENNVTISAPEASCTITLQAAKNQSLNTVKFENTPANKGILLLANVTKITSAGVGGCPYEEESNGKYEGNLHVTVEGGLLKWDLNA